MFGTAVRKNSSTAIRPRASADRPASGSRSSSVMPCRPAEYITVSAGIFFRLRSEAIAPPGLVFTDETVSPNRNVTPRSRRWYLSASTTSRSQNSSIRSRCSTTVTLVPRAANIEAYSIPITPAPATTIERGTRSRWMMPSESMTVRSSKSTLAGRAGVAGGDNDLVRADAAQPALAVVDLDRVRPGEPGGAGDDADPVACQLAADHVVFPADHVLRARRQVGDGDLVLHPVALPVHFPLVEAGEVEHGLPERLGRDRAGIQAHAAHHVGALDDADVPLQLGRGDGRLLAARARSDDQQVEVMHDHQCDHAGPSFESPPGHRPAAGPGLPRIRPVHVVVPRCGRDPLAVVPRQQRAARRGQRRDGPPVRVRHESNARRSLPGLAGAGRPLLD